LHEILFLHKKYLNSNLFIVRNYTNIKKDKKRLDKSKKMWYNIVKVNKLDNKGGLYGEERFS